MDRPGSRFQIFRPPLVSPSALEGEALALVKSRVSLLGRLSPTSGVSLDQSDDSQSNRLQVFKGDEDAHGAREHQAQLEPKQKAEMKRPSSGGSPTRRLQLLFQKKIPPFNYSSKGEHLEEHHEQSHHLHRKDGFMLAPGSLLGTPRLSDFYKVQHELGKAHLGVVNLVRCGATRKLFACKTIYKKLITKPRILEELKMEVLAMAEMQLSGNTTAGPSRGPFLVRLHEVFDDEEAVHLVVDYCDGGDLLHYVVGKGRLSEAECSAMLLQLLTGLQDLHRMGFVHRDIKPENILLLKKELGSASDLVQLLAHHHRDFSFKLADFGSCVKLGPAMATSGLAGSPKYMAPEVVQGKEYGKAVDVWSLGVVLYCCLAGCQPFVGQEVDDVFKAVCSCSPDFSKPPWSSISLEAKSLVTSMLCKDPTKRITVEEIFLHPWLLKFHGPASAVVGHALPNRCSNPISLHC